MKLQGKNVKFLSKKQKAKMENTLADMEENRKKDSIQLRQSIQQKITWLLEQQVNADKVEKKLLEQLEQLKMQKSRIIGALTVLRELITSKDEE